MLNVIQAFKRGGLTEERLWEEALTKAGSGLYSYMIMLQSLGRDEEADLLEKCRKTIFEVRDHFNEDRILAASMLREVTGRIDAQYKTLCYHAPKEAPCLRNATDELIGAAHYLNPYKHLNPSKNSLR